jgi:hypothetical protein
MGKINLRELKLIQSRMNSKFLSIDDLFLFRNMLAWIRITINIKSTENSKIPFFRKTYSNKLVVYNSVFLGIFYFLFIDKIIFYDTYFDLFIINQLMYSLVLFIVIKFVCLKRKNINV